MRRVVFILLCLLSLAAVWFFWPSAKQALPVAKSSAPSLPAIAAATVAASNAVASVGHSPANTNRLAFRLANTAVSIGQLAKQSHAILLENALLDTDLKLDLSIPKQLQAADEPGAFIVQARGAIDNRFRSALAAAGGQIVSYIPNNAYLARLSSAGAAALRGNRLVQAVLPYEPYFKVQSSLLSLAAENKPLTPGTVLTLGLFAADAGETEQQLEKQGAKIIGRDQSPFGPVVNVLPPPTDWMALARLPGVQVIFPAHQRVSVNDLSRVTVGVATDTLVSSNYLDLTGANVLVSVNDSGIDATHPDLAGRVTGFTPGDLTDKNGHGTFVAGIIAGNGSESSTINSDVSTLPEGSVMGADFRGKAPAAKLFSINNGHSDFLLQTTAAATNALISNNSWVYEGDADYDLAAASYDAATRDALPGTTGSQPMVFVFGAGNGGGGNNDGGEGSADTIFSPGTAKNVITVGALEQIRNITNIVTTVTDGVTNRSAAWQTQTDSGAQVAGYSSRGNVGIGTEGTYGRFKPDVVAPGTFVVSTRSAQWDTNAYFNPTNVSVTPYTGQLVRTNSLTYYSVSVPPNAVSVNITISSNKFSHPFPPDMPIYVKQASYPALPSDYDFVTTKNSFLIPGDADLAPYLNNGFTFAVGNNTNVTLDYDLTVSIATTNDMGDYYQVLEGMDETMAPYYRYESGTSLSAADVSGVLALMEDYFTNKLQQTPSPALLKAMLINGARSIGSYSLAVTNGLNFQGWGLVNLTNSLPFSATNSTTTNSPMFFVDQSPANALATGDSHTYLLNLDTNNFANYLPLQATLVWTDPSGDPAAALKLVNNLDLVITNLDTGEVYMGNDISQDVGYNLPWNTNLPPNFDTINNVENIILPPLLAGSYSVTVVGRLVNVNAVTAQTNSVVQDYALVVSCGEGELPAPFTSVTDNPIVSNPTGDQQITFVTTTNSPLFNQFAGENSPLLGDGTLPLGTNTVWGSNGQMTIGMTNQWHFYVATNNALDSGGSNADVTNAAFITFDSATLSLPVMGTHADTVANATRPEADIDLYVTTDSNLLVLSPITISNCLNSVGDGRASLGTGGTEFTFYTNSAPGKVYYIGVKSEDHEASEYAFLPVFTATPFSELDQNGNQIVNGLLLPVGIPDGNNAHPGVANVFALAIYPMTVAKVTVNNLNQHENFGDLFGAMSFGGTSVVLNNHAGLGNTLNDTLPLVYDDSRDPVVGTTNTDGPGSLTDFRGKSGLGPWILTEMDNSFTQTGMVTQFNLVIQPHRDLTDGSVIVVVPAHGWYIDYVDVPPGYTNLTFNATNLPPTVAPQPLQMYEKFGDEPTLDDFDQEADLTNCLTGTYPTGLEPGNSISVGPPLPQGQYFIGIYNPSDTIATNVLLSATLGFGSTVDDTYTITTNPATALLDDAVTGSTLHVAATNLISSVNVGLVVDTARASDLTFTLVSPTGQRILLMENRGDTNAAGIGHLNYTTNFFGTQLAGTNGLAVTNSIGPVTNSGILLVTYDFEQIADTMDVYYDGVDIFSSGLVSGAGQFTIPYGPGIATNLVIVMDQTINSPTNTTQWSYTPTVVSADYSYLTFTDDTNLTQVPIKFGIPPYDFEDSGTNFTFSDFESSTNGDYFAPTNIFDLMGGWNLPTNLVTVSSVFNFTNNQFELVTNVTVLTNNEVSVVNDPSTAQAGSNYLALGLGTLTRDLSFTVGRKYQLIYAYRGPGLAGWWRGEGNASDSSNPENNGNNGSLVGRFNFPVGQVGQAFQLEDPGAQLEFEGTNNFVQIPQNPSLDVGNGGGFTIEGWINPTNVAHAQPLVEWLAHVPTNSAVTNLVIVAGPVLNRATDHYYYLLGATNWTASEFWATQLGGHLVTLDTANEQNWVFDNFARYGEMNRNLWIGLTNSPPAAFGWVGGLTNFTYTNWLASQPLNCDNTRNYTLMFGGTNAQSGLWALADNDGFICNSTATNKVYGVVEVDNIQTNGVQFWVSVTNSPGTTNTIVASNGCLYANIVDTNFISHEIYSAPGLIQSNVYQHVALTFNTNSGIAMLYLDGTNVATTNLFMTTGALVPFVPKTDGDVLLGHDMTRATNNYYGGKMDEMSIYNRSLSDAEIAAIYRVSTADTNGLAGKFDPSITPAFGLAEAQVSLGTTTNFILGANNQWQVNGFAFTATTNSLPLQITGLQPGMLLDSFSVSEIPQSSLYYLPEQALAALTGASAAGDWTLQVWDNRVGAFVTNDLSQLVSWQLTFVLQSNATVVASIAPQTPTSASVGIGQIINYSVTVPTWAHFATNILVSSTDPVDVLFNQNNPTTGGPDDLTIINGQSAPPAVIGNPVLAADPPVSTPPLIPGQTYYLGVRNLGAHLASVVLEVDYDITALTNGVPYTGILTTNDSDAVRYFSYDVSSNALETTFQLLDLSSNADLVIRKGVPLPVLTSSDYGSFSVSNLDESIYVLTNSSPLPLSAGRWYLGVIRRDSGPVKYSVLAKELETNQPVNIVDLTNGVPVNFTSAPGAALTNFFRFHVTNSVVGGVTNFVQGLRFELYNLTGDGDLTVQTNALPQAPPFFQTSQQGGRNPELMLVYTNGALTNLTADWYLGVPDRDAVPINYTIVAVIETNSYFPAFPNAAGSGGGAVGGRFGGVYHVTSLGDSGGGTLRAAVSATNRTVVFDVSGTINLLSPLVITNSYLTIAGQTAPGGGITVAGDMTTVQSAHDVVIRNVRFRRGAPDDSLMLTNVANIIADHISAAWSSDNVLSALNSSNVTVQWSIMADSLYNSANPQGIGSLLRYGNGALSFNHNLYADNYSGSPRLGDNLSLDFVNNVIYNWGLFPGLSGGTNDLDASLNGCTNQLNYVCNYLIAGPDTARFATNFAITNIAFFGGMTNDQVANWIFQTNNLIDSNTNGILGGTDTEWAMFTNKYTRFEHPFPLIPVPTDEAFLAYEKVLDFAGVNMGLRDPVDADIVTKVRNQTGTLISAPPLSGMVAWWKAENNMLDSVGTNNGSIIGSITYTNGEVGQAFDFDGTSFVQVHDAPNLHFTNAMTAEAWVNLRTFSGDGSREIISKLGPDAPNQGSFTLSINLGSHHAYFVVDTTGGVPGIATGSTVIPTNQWIHVAGVYDGSAIKIYVNGQLDGTTPWTQGIFPGDSPLVIGCTLQNDSSPNSFFNGLIDEVSIYKRALSSDEIAAIYHAGSAGKLSASTRALPYLDTDQDGIPDFWEITLGENPTNSLPQDRDGDGYYDLEEYLNWLAAPHALTVTNTPVGIDLQQLFGKTGNLSFTVDHAVQGSVYLTNVLNYTNSLGIGYSVTNTGPFSNSIAFFTPATAGTNFSGYASFDVYVTNRDTVAYFGPVNVSVMVSAVPILYATITNFPPVFPNTNLNLSIDELVPLTVTNTATDDTNQTLTYVLYFSIDTNAMIANGWPLDYVTNNPAPVIDPNTGVITWTPSEEQGPGVYTLITVATDDGLPPMSATNILTLTVNEVNLAPFWPTNVPSQTNYIIPVLNTLVVNDTAMDLDIPPNPLSYQLLGPPGAVIDTNGVITWTPSVAQAGNVYTFTNIVTDTNRYALFNKSLSATNYFTVTVPAIFAPFAFTEPATLVTGINAQLNGMATPNGLPAAAWFEWGTNTAYGSNTPPISVGAGYNVVFVPSPISGLTPNVSYHFRLMVSNLVGVAYGFDQVLDQAQVVAWGADYAGQTAVPLDLSNVVAIAGAYDHSLALKNDGTALGWGDDTFGQATVPAGLNNLTALAGGEYYSLALRNNGTVASWGANILGQTNVPAGLNNVVEIAGGTFTSLALRNNGAVVAWGYSFFNLTNVPAGLSNVVAIAGGSYHNLALRNNGTVVAWGDNSASQTDVPPDLTNVVAIAAGSFHNLALRNDGTVVSWGDDSVGQTNVPPGLTNVIAVAAGGFHSLALKNNGSVVAWGDNTAGQTNAPVGLGNVVAIASGYLHSLALTPFFDANPTNPVIFGISNGVPATASIGAGGVIYYEVYVPKNVDSTTNTLLYTIDKPLNVWFTTNTPPDITGANVLLAGVTNGVSILNTASAPTNIVPGAVYYLGIQNTNGASVNYGLEVDFHFVTTSNTPPVLPLQPDRVINPLNPLVVTNMATDADVPAQTLTYSLVSTVTGTNQPVINLTNGVITWTPDVSQGGTSNIFTTIVTDDGVPSLSATNAFAVVVTPVPDIGGVIQTNGGFLLTWYAPTNDIFNVQVATNLGSPTVWQTFSNIITYSGPVTPTNGLFSFFDDGSQYPFGGLRFYRLILVGITSSTPPGSSNTPPVLPAQTNRIVNPLNPLVVTNMATDADVPAQTLTYSLVSTVTGTNQPVINLTNGVITWTPDVSQGGTSNIFTTIVTDDGVPSLSATNAFAVVVTPVPDIGGVIQTNGGFLLTWYAPTNDIFNVQVATNLGSPTVWQTFSNIITYSGPVTPTNGLFSFFDDGSQYPFGGLRFYRLILVGITSSTPPGSSNTPPVLPAQTNRIVNPLNPLVVTNVATDADVPAQTLTYSLVSTVTGTNQPVINLTNGVIIWTPDVSQGGTSNVFTTIVTDNGTPNLSATNVFAVIVNPVPDISGEVYANGKITLTWYAPSNDLFMVQYKDSLGAATWTSFTNTVSYNPGYPASATNAQFIFVDDGSQTGGVLGSPRFYKIELTGVTSLASPPPVTNSVAISTSISPSGQFQLTWSAPTNAQFQVRWTTNIVPPFTWFTFPDIITSTTGAFIFTDTNAPMLMKFYELILLP